MSDFKSSHYTGIPGLPRPGQEVRVVSALRIVNNIHVTLHGNATYHQVDVGVTGRILSVGPAAVTVDLQDMPLGEALRLDVAKVVWGTHFEALSG